MKKIELTEADFVAGNVLGHRIHFYLQALMAGGIFWVLTFAYGFFIKGEVEAVRLIVVGSILMMGAYFFSRLYVIRKAKKIFAQEAFFHKPYTVDVAPDGRVTISHENHVTEIPQDKVVKLKRNSDLILIFISDLRMFFVPRRYFDDQKQFEDFFATIKRYYGK